MTSQQTIVSLATERAVAATESWRMMAADESPLAVPPEPGPDDWAALEHFVGRAPSSRERRAFERAYCESAELLRHGGPAGTDRGGGLSTGGRAQR